MASEYDIYKKYTAGQRAGNMASGATKGLQTGAMLGSVIPGVGTGVGALVGGGLGALVGAGQQKQLTPYEEKNFERLAELEKKMAAGTLGLTEEEKRLMYDIAETRERTARQAAQEQRGKMAASQFQGAGASFMEMAKADEMAVEAARQTGIEVGKADLIQKAKEEQEYWGRLAAMSAREATEHENAQERNKESLNAINEIIASEITTGGAPGSGTGAVQGLAKKFGTDTVEMEASIKALQDNPELLQLLITAMGKK
tara:strand:- start:562 stop:1332 length:771 start_codon:yes stop_codon:yes gene_type:complete